MTLVNFDVSAVLSFLFPLPSFSGLNSLYFLWLGFFLVLLDFTGMEGDMFEMWEGFLMERMGEEVRDFRGITENV